MDDFKPGMIKRAAHKSGNEKLVLHNTFDLADKNAEEIYETDWNRLEEGTTLTVKRHRVDGSTPQYLKVDRRKVEQLEKLALSHKVKPTYRRTAIAKNNPRDKTRIYSLIPIYSERLSEGPIFDLCKQMIPRGQMNAVQINSYEPKKGEDAATPHTDRNVGDSFTIVFGRFTGGILEIEGEKPHAIKRVWRRYDASKSHRVTEVTSGLRVSVTAFWAPNTAHAVEQEDEEPPAVVAEPSELPESERLLFTPKELTEREQSIVMLLREERFCYEAANGRRIRLLPLDAPIPEIASEPEERWDVWEFNSEDEVFSKEAERFGLKAGPN